jgi:hypothetical protein
MRNALFLVWKAFLSSDVSTSHLDEVIRAVFSCFACSFCLFPLSIGLRGHGSEGIRSRCWGMMACFIHTCGKGYLNWWRGLPRGDACGWGDYHGKCSDFR